MAQNVKLLNGLAIANVKTFRGLAIASVKTINGVDNTASSFSPTDIAGLVGWWKADAQAYVSGTTQAVDGESVATWADQSGNSNNFTPSPLEPTKPIFKTAIVGSLPVIRGGACYMDSVSTISKPFTVFVVERVTTNSSPQRTIAAYDSTGNFVISGGRNDGFSCYLDGLVSGYSTTATAMACGVLRGPSTGDMAYYVNGVDRTTSSASTPSSLRATLGQGSARPCDSDVCEICIYNSALSSGDRTSVETYLRSAARWNF